MSIEDFREILRLRAEFLTEAVALAAAKWVGVEKRAQGIEVATTGEPSAAQQERAALEQEARNRTPAQRALVAAFNKRAAAARAADKRRYD